MKTHLPLYLIYLRLLFSLLVILLAPSALTFAPCIVIGLMYAGILSDIFDGILARNLNVSTASLRQLDTIVDLVFYFSLVYYLLIFNPSPLQKNSALILVILCLEMLMYGTSLSRFGKLPSPHAILSKFWGIYLIVEFTLLLLQVQGAHFTIALMTGILVHTDRFLIYLFLPLWEHDVPSSWHAWQARHGHAIRRRKLFNG